MSHIVCMSDDCKDSLDHLKAGIPTHQCEMYWTTNLSPNETVWRDLRFFLKLHFDSIVFVVDVILFPKAFLFLCTYSNSTSFLQVSDILMFVKNNCEM